MKRSSFLGILLWLAFGHLSGQSSFPSYYTQSDFRFASSGALKFGLYGYDNPALLTYVHQPDFLFSWSALNGKITESDRWGLFAAAPHVGFGLIRQYVGNNSITDYKISTGFGNRSMGVGFSYGWATGDKALFNHSSLVAGGLLIRPYRFFSLGIVGSTSTSKGDKEAVFDVAIRPLSNELVTIFADYVSRNNRIPGEPEWSAGAVVEPFPGIRIIGRSFDTKAFSIGLQLSLGNAEISSQARYDESQKYSYTTYSVRLGAYDRNVLRNISSRTEYTEINLFGPVNYQRFQFFDKSNTLSELLAIIDASKTDPAISGIAINTSGVNASREMFWELREKLKEFKMTGKHVVIYIDRANIDVYQLSSVADKIVMDPAGMITLEGFVAGRTFIKGTLEKLGIGYDEWRFFKYKSANESFSRDKMSDADREQRQKLVDDSYTLAKHDICETRRIAPDRFDELVGKQMIFLPQEALEAGLVDTLGRWEGVKAVMKNIEGGDRSFRTGESLEAFQLPNDHYWSEPPKIAVLYSLGICAMDEGIRARQLVKYVEAATKDDLIKAVVLRVDSPGGDPLASDVVAEALKECRKKKPVIVSQGSVAASGGYWLSMYGDTIVAAPNTITGSIGVIGGWLYNKSFKETLGMSTDLVKAGEHADVGFGFTLPLIGLGIPDRNLTTDERARAEQSIKSLYKEFVSKVAFGRKKKSEDIEPIAQGRVWSGSEGKQKGLVDIIGGLDDAIRIARERAGISKDQPVTILHLPPKGLLDLSGFSPRFFGFETAQKDLWLDLLKFRLKHNGEPLPMLPLEDLLSQ